MGNDRTPAARIRRGGSQAARLGLIALLLAALAAPATPAGAAPRSAERIVSMNLCTDSMLFELVDSARIASVTALSRDPNLSVFHDVVTMHVNRGHVEEIVAVQPDLVITDRTTAPMTRRLLRKLGISVLEFAHANTFETYRENLLRLAEATGTTDRARKILARYPQRNPDVATTGPRALVYQPNGFAPGTATLMANIIGAAGYRNAAAELGLQFGGFVALESLIVLAPDAVIFSARDAVTPSLAEAHLQHPALRHFLGTGDPVPRQLSVPERLWTCAGLHNVDAIDMLRAGRG